MSFVEACACEMSPCKECSCEVSSCDVCSCEMSSCDVCSCELSSSVSDEPSEMQSSSCDEHGRCERELVSNSSYSCLHTGTDGDYVQECE